MEFGDYIVFVDESGDHGLETIDPEYPIFCLAFCIFKKEDYANYVIPKVTEFKFKWFGHDSIILHESDIVKRRDPFAFLRYDRVRDKFMSDLSFLLEQMPMTVIASVINKQTLKLKYPFPYNPYDLSLLFCLEMTHKLLTEMSNANKVCHVICESRSPRQKEGRGKEDMDLEYEFEKICSATHTLRRDLEPMKEFDLRFVAKQANSSGLQIADLVARPIGLKKLRPQQKNRAYGIIERKLWKKQVDKKWGFVSHAGLKYFP